MRDTSLRDFSVQHPERRLRMRFPLRCPLKLSSTVDQRHVFGETVNISSGGFQGIIEHQFQPGENLTCVLELPPESPWSFRAAPRLLCNAVVTRLEERDDGQYKVACRITNYTFSRRDVSN